MGILLCRSSKHDSRQSKEWLVGTFGSRESIHSIQTLHCNGSGGRTNSCNWRSYLEGRAAFLLGMRALAQGGPRIRLVEGKKVSPMFGKGGRIGKGAKWVLELYPLWLYPRYRVWLQLQRLDAGYIHRHWEMCIVFVTYYISNWFSLK